jgi:hypothetical protein
MPYLITAYAIVVGSLVAYALWIRRARSRLQQARNRESRGRADR